MILIKTLEAVGQQFLSFLVGQHVILFLVWRIFRLLYLLLVKAQTLSGVDINEQF